MQIMFAHNLCEKIVPTNRNSLFKMFRKNNVSFQNSLYSGKIITSAFRGTFLKDNLTNMLIIQQ